MTVEQVEPLVWQEIARGFADYNFEQSSDYAMAMAESMGGTVDFYVVRDQGHILGGACVRIKSMLGLRRGIAYISGGVLVKSWDGMPFEDRHRSVLEVVKRELVDKQKHYLFARAPILPADESNLHKNFTDLDFRETDRVRKYRTVLIDLRPDLDVIRANLGRKWRRNLNYATRMGLQLEQGADLAFQARFMTLFGDMVGTKNFNVHVDPNAFFKLPAESTGLVILIVTKDGQDVAGHVLSLLGNTAVNPFGASNEQGRATKAGYWMSWQAIELARAQGMHWYDLGGIDPEINPGGYEFKSRMGGQDITATGPYEARPGGLIGAVSETLLNLRARLKTR